MTPNNAIFRRVVVGAEYRPLSEKRLIGTVDISTPPTNSDPVFFKSDDDGEALSVPGEFHHFVNINLADIYARGNPGDVVTIIGGAW